ncbi:hypothetical protein [Actinoplanes sp. L3-i22]|uniref:hypothetical protein n=1 Tax=Actinoplanes sp. L3-i22 TaxID=2836373 RepID=UPI001C743361|nr:hypothetical protein [Actinoplanes sp. L3-i22]BCY07251.1 hypothetical protein L3i22_023390 [Actinoplanes sp. L3-i22]
MPIDRDDDLPFASELFLTLAREGRLVLDAADADRAIAGLQHALDVVRARLGAVRDRTGLDPGPAAGFAGDGSAELVNAVFIEQIAPGFLQRAAVELPRYIAALRAARRPAAVREPG